MPNDSLNARPSASRCRSPGDSWVPANQDPTITFAAPAASASATSRGYRTPPSAHTCLPSARAAAEHSSTAENWGRPTPVIIRVVHIAPGPTPTLTTSAPASTRSRTPSAVTTLPATSGIRRPPGHVAVDADRRADHQLAVGVQGRPVQGGAERGLAGHHTDQPVPLDHQGR